MALTPQKLCTTLADGRVLTYEKMCVMGILNVTPDSFYEGSRVPAMEELVERAGRMLAAGAGVLDIGGESTRPGSDSVDGEEERRRVVPALALAAVITGICTHFGDYVYSVRLDEVGNYVTETASKLSFAPVHQYSGTIQLIALIIMACSTVLFAIFAISICVI